MSLAGRVGVGFTLQPEAAYLELLDAVIEEEPDYYELAPETTWKPGAAREGQQTDDDGAGRRLLRRWDGRRAAR